MAKTLSVSDGRQQYRLEIKTDASLDPRHDKKENLLKAGECFAHTAFLARWELCQGLVRGGVSHQDAVKLPRDYFEEKILKYFGKLASFTKAPKVPPEWTTLMRWKPEPNRFRLWFGVDWNDIPDTDNRETKGSFRRTILGTLLGLLGNERHSLHLNTGTSETMGISYPALRDRYWFNPKGYGGTLTYTTLNDWISRSEELFGCFEVHPFCFQDFALGIVHVRKRESPTTIKMKRPTKRYKGESTEWKAQWCHTLFHEASHDYGSTLDYFYLSFDPSTLKIRTYCPLDCKHALIRAVSEDVQVGQVLGQAYPSFPDRFAQMRLSLANADSVAAYLMGYRSPDEFVLTQA